MQQSFLPSIWSSSPCTLPHTNRMASFQKSRRFEFNSIYYKDDPHRPKLEQSPYSRPEFMLKEFRKKIKEATKSHHAADYIKKKKKGDLEEKMFQTINLKASEVTGRLYESPRSILQMKYDLNGNRSSFFESQHSNQKQNKMSGRSLSPKQLKLMKHAKKQSDNIYITSTHRTDFSRPLNFNPGPGSYVKEIKRSGRPSRSLLMEELEARRVGNGSVVGRLESEASGKSIEKSRFETVEVNKEFGERSNALLMKRMNNLKVKKEAVQN